MIRAINQELGHIWFLKMFNIDICNFMYYMFYNLYFMYFVYLIISAFFFRCHYICIYVCDVTLFIFLL